MIKHRVILTSNMIDEAWNKRGNKQSQLVSFHRLIPRQGKSFPRGRKNNVQINDTMTIVDLRKCDCLKTPHDDASLKVSTALDFTG